MGDKLSSWLTEELGNRAWSFRELARRSGISTQSIMRYANGERTPNPESCRKIADALDFPYRDMLVMAGHLPEEDETTTIHLSDLTTQELEIINTFRKGRGQPPLPLKPVEPKQELGQWLRIQLKHREWSNEELSNRSGVPLDLVNEYVSGDTIPEIADCEKLADALDAYSLEVVAMAGHTGSMYLEAISAPLRQAFRAFRRLDNTSRLTFLSAMQFYIQEEEEEGLEVGAFKHSVFTFTSQYPSTNSIFDKAEEELPGNAVNSLMDAVRMFISTSSTDERIIVDDEMIEKYLETLRELLYRANEEERTGK